LTAGELFTSLHTFRKALEDFSSVQAKKGVGRFNNNSLGVQEGAVTTPSVFLQRMVREAFVSYTERSEKCINIVLVLAKKN
jgi:hypothetical protein